jgi:hypothetical protein
MHCYPSFTIDNSCSGDLPPETSKPIPCGVLHTVVGRSSGLGLEALKLLLLIAASQVINSVRMANFVSIYRCGAALDSHQLPY